MIEVLGQIISVGLNRRIDDKARHKVSQQSWHIQQLGHRPSQVLVEPLSGSCKIEGQEFVEVELNIFVGVVRRKFVEVERSRFVEAERSRFVEVVEHWRSLQVLYGRWR